MRIISIANQKGGCGKTTTSVNLAACLAKAGKKVLVIDMDPQGHATLALNVNPQDVEKTMYNVLSPNGEKRTRLDEIIISVSENLDLAGANILLSAIEQELSGKPEREAKLAQAIAGMSEFRSYEYVIIDCSPSLGILTFNALRASNELIAPVDTGFFALHGISRLLETVNLVETQLNYKIKVKALITMYDCRTKFSQEVKDEIYKHFSGRVFDTVIHNNVKLKESTSFGKPVVSYDKHSRGAIDYVSLSQELMGTRYDSRKSRETQRAEQKKDKPVVLTYFGPEANSVDIAGDFNNWVVTQESKLINNEKGVWAKIFSLEPGRYRYKLVVDGKWITDPSNPNTETDNVGNVNSLLEIK